MDRESSSQLHDLGNQPVILDRIYDAAQVQRYLSHDRADGPIVSAGGVDVYDMILTHEKLFYIWAQATKLKALFWHPGLHKVENFVTAITQPGWLWYEVYKNGLLTGMVYYTNVASMVDVQVHALFFDRKMTDKVEAGKALNRRLFDRYYLERIEAALPEPFYSTHRYVERMGFKYEGTRRKAVIYKSQFVNQKIYGLTREEL